MVKYRGSAHGTNEYPFLIDEQGLSILPITSLGLSHEALTERVSTGIPRLDAMFAGGGYYRGSSVLVSGGAGTGKTSLAAHFADVLCRGGGRTLFFAFEESESQILRNMRSIGLDLSRWTRKGLLAFTRRGRSSADWRCTWSGCTGSSGLQAPGVVVDPVTNLIKAGSPIDVSAMLTRLADHLKTEGITSLYTSPRCQ